MQNVVDNYDNSSVNFSFKPVLSNKIAFQNWQLFLKNSISKKNLYYIMLVGFINMIAVLFANAAFGQDLNKLKVKLDLRNASLIESLKEVQQQSGIKISFYEQLLEKETKKVSLQTSSISVSEALSQILGNTNLTYRPFRDFIVIEAKPQPAKNGRIIGKVSDINDGSAIYGATLLIGTRAVSTDSLGLFDLSLPAGTYVAQVSYIGYGSKNITEINIQEGKTFTLDIPMTRGKGQLQQVTVTARRMRETGTNANLILEIREADAVISGISKEQINRSQDRDAAEVVRRIPGVSVIQNKFIIIRGLPQRFNSVMLNNVVAPSFEADSRAFSFDIIPSGMIDRIMIYKSASPELPGDFAGGMVKVYTTAVPVRNNFTVNYSSSYNPNSTFANFYEQQQGEKFWMGYDDGTYKLPSFADGKLHPEQSSYEERREVTKQFNNNWEASPKRAAPDQRLSLSLERRVRIANEVQLGIISSFGYTNTFDHTQYARTTRFVKTEEEGVLTENYAYALSGSEDQYERNIRLNGVANFSLDIKQGKHRFDFRNLYTHQGGSNYMERMVIAGGWSNEEAALYPENYYQQRQLSNSFRGIYSGQFSGKHHLFKDQTQIEWVMGLTQGSYDAPDERSRTRSGGKGVAENGEFEWGKWTTGEKRMDFIRESRMYYNLPEKTYTLGMDIHQELHVGEWKPVLKAGFFYEDKKRDFTTRWFGSIRDQEDALQESQLTWNSYNATNLLKAAYFSTEIPFLKRFNLQAGFRLEDNQMRLKSEQSWRTVGPDKGPVDVDKQHTSWLPSANLSYHVTDKTLLRAAFSKTLNRPEFREISDAYYYDMVNMRYVYGNTGLKSQTNIRNYDLRLEHYPGAGEMISLGFFYKQFENPIEFEFSPSTTSVAYIWGNAKAATNYGAELDMMLGMGRYGDGNTWISKQIQKISLLLNAAYIFSEVDFAENAGYYTGDKRALYGQSPYTINFGLNFTDEHVGMKFNASYNIIGKRIVAVGLMNLVPSEYELPRHSLDLSLSQRIAKRLELKLGLQNLLNAQHIQMRDSNKDGKFTVPTSVLPNSSWQDGRELSWFSGTYYSLGLQFKL